MQLCYHKSSQSLLVGSNHFIWVSECVCVNPHGDMCVLLCVCVCTFTPTPLISVLKEDHYFHLLRPHFLSKKIYMHIYMGVCAYISIYIFPAVSFLHLELVEGGESRRKFAITVSDMVCKYVL